MSLVPIHMANCIVTASKLSMVQSVKGRRKLVGDWQLISISASLLVRVFSLLYRRSELKPVGSVGSRRFLLSRLSPGMKIRVVVVLGGRCEGVRHQIFQGIAAFFLMSRLFFLLSHSNLSTKDFFAR